MYEVLLERRAERDLNRLESAEFRRVVREIRALAEDPRPAGCRKIAGSQGDWRLRVGDYRVIDTQKVLRKWFKRLPERNKWRKELYGSLSDLLNSHRKTPNQKTAIHVPKTGR